MKRALLLLVLPALLVGCGGGDTLSIDAVAQAADKTAAQKSARFEMSMQMHVEALSEPLRMFGSGELDYENQRMRMELDMSELLNLGGGETASSPDLEFSMVMDFPIMYMKLPKAAMGEAGAPKTPWVKVDLSKATGVDLSQLSQFSQNPADQLQMLRTVSDNVEERGKKTVRGVKTTHFHATIDLDKALEQGLRQVPAAQREQTRRALEAMAKQSGLDELPIDVFLDDEGVVRRMLMDMETTVEGQSMRMVMTMDFFDFGAPVDVTPPPAGQVTDVTDQLQGELGG
jgi:hypothetical protein